MKTTEKETRGRRRECREQVEVAAGRRRGAPRWRGGGCSARASTEAEAEASAAAATLDDDSGDLVVFAFRMTRAEREEIHDAAGPAKASRFTRTVVLAAARGDLATIQTAVKETRKAAAS